MSSQQKREIKQEIYDFFSELMKKYGLRLSEEYERSGDTTTLHLQKKSQDSETYYSIDILEAIKKGNK